jgi:hypothetical protein
MKVELGRAGKTKISAALPPYPDMGTSIFNRTGLYVLMLST